MDGLLSLLVFVGLFFVMMRFGCGAHMLRGRHSQKESNDSPKNGHIDPVCGKTVPPIEGYGVMHDGQLFRFCSRECLDAFDTNPNRFTHQPAQLTSQERSVRQGNSD